MLYSKKIEHYISIQYLEQKNNHATRHFSSIVSRRKVTSRIVWNDNLILVLRLHPSL